MHILIKSFTIGCLGIVGTTSFAQTASNFLVPDSNKPHLTSGKRAFHTNYLIYTGTWKHKSMDDVSELLARHGPVQSGVSGYHPSDILAAYKIPANSGTRAIAVIDAFDLPTNLNDFNAFSSEFGLPTETSSVANASTNKVFQVVYPGGAKPKSDGDWGGEIAIDMEWAHAVAPMAKIYLVECASDSESDLFAGVQYVNANLPDVGEISMSFGGNEDPTELQTDSIFTEPNVVYLAASGDTPNTVSYPATSPNVVAVGGTTLNLSDGNVQSEVYWYDPSEDAGGSAGLSQYEPRPSYQNPYESIVGNFRGTNDMAADADPDTGCAIFDSTPIPDDKNASGWLVFGGTSLACPICAGILNDRGYNQASSFSELTQLYGLAGTSYFRDITVGSSGTLKAGPGYDLLTGLGAPTGLFVNHVFSMTAASLVTGTPVSGVLGNMVAKDNHDYVVRSVQSGSNQIATVATTFTGSTAGSSAVGATIAITGICGAADTVVYALNPTTNNYDVLGSIELGLTTTTATLSTSSISNYINSSGAVQLRIGGNGAVTASFRLSIDQVTFTAGSLK